MKQKKKKTPAKNSLLDINTRLVLLENASAALHMHNFNLAQVWVQDYLAATPKKIRDPSLTKSIHHALEKRDAELLAATIDAEIERVRTDKVKLLRAKIITRD